MENKISGFSKLLLLVAALFLIVSLFVPLWSISLDAPQYPEGLMLEIWPNKIAGDVDIINGLNHYIGMKTLNTNDFIEFTILPYIIGFFCTFIYTYFGHSSKKMAIHCFCQLCIIWHYCYGRFLEMGI